MAALDETTTANGISFALTDEQKALRDLVKGLA